MFKAHYSIIKWNLALFKTANEFLAFSLIHISITYMHFPLTWLLLYRNNAVLKYPILKKIYKENGFKLYYKVIFLELEKAIKCVLLWNTSDKELGGFKLELMRKTLLWRLPLTALQSSMQADKGVERTIVLPSCNVHEPQEWPEWQGVQKVQ